MIFDELNNMRHYKGIHPNLDQALDFLVQHDVATDDLGRYEIDGNKVFYVIQENTLVQDESQKFEFHKRYLDLHILLKGRELIRYALAVDTVIQPYEKEIDFASARAKEEVDIYLTPQNFVAFLPNELHQPNGYANQGSKVRKCVVKIQLSEK